MAEFVNFMNSVEQKIGVSKKQEGVVWSLKLNISHKENQQHCSSEKQNLHTSLTLFALSCNGGRKQGT